MGAEIGRRKNGAGSYWPRTDGRWVAAVTLPTGGRRYRYYRTAREAELGLAMMATGLYGKPYVGAKSITFSQLAARWLEDVVRTTVESNTYYGYELSIRHVAPFLASVTLDGLTAELLQRTYMSLLDQGLSKTTVNHTHFVLHNCFQTAVAWNWITLNPAKQARPPKPNRYRVEPLSEQDLLRVFRLTAGSRWHVLWVLLATTGMRLGEALGLTWNSIFMERSEAAYVLIRQAMKRSRTPDKPYWHLGPTKTPSSNRRIRLAPDVVELLQGQLEQQGVERAAAADQWEELGLVFPSASGRPMPATELPFHFRQALSAAGLPRHRVHDLRHSCAANLLRRNVAPQVVQALLGHSTITTTLDIYAAWIPSLADSTADLQQDWISKIRA